MFSSPSFLEFPPPLSSPFSSNNESPVNQNKIVDDFVSSLLAREELEKYSSSGSSPNAFLSNCSSPSACTSPSSPSSSSTSSSSSSSAASSPLKPEGSSIESSGFLELSPHFTASLKHLLMDKENTYAPEDWPPLSSPLEEPLKVLTNEFAENLGIRDIPMDSGFLSPSGICNNQPGKPGDLFQHSSSPFMGEGEEEDKQGRRREFIPILKRHSSALRSITNEATYHGNMSPHHHHNSTGDVFESGLIPPPEFMRKMPPPKALPLPIPPLDLSQGGPSWMMEIPPPSFYYGAPNFHRPPLGAQPLNHRLQECLAMFKHLEKERKRTEAQLARAFPGQRVSSSNSVSFPRLPPNPSKVDRLIIDQLREHARVATLLAKMDRLRGGRPLHRSIKESLELWMDTIKAVQVKRRDEILNAEVHPFEEKGALALANSIQNLTLATRKVRSSMWSGLQATTLFHLDPEIASGERTPSENERALRIEGGSELIIHS